MWSRMQGLFGPTLVGFSLLAACSLDVQGRQGMRPDDPGQTSSADVIPGSSPAVVDDAGTAATDAATPPPSPSLGPDGATPLAPATASPGAACGSAQCNPSDICCIEFNGPTSMRACTSGDCNGARIACDEPSDCPGNVCCLTNAPPGPGDPPRTKCDSKCEDGKETHVCDPAVGCAKGTCTLHAFFGLYYCR